MKIIKGNTVLIISGKDKGRKGKVLQALPKENKIVVEGINLRKKHQKPKKTGEKGQIIELPGPFSISNVKLICPKCKKATKVGYKIKPKTKNQSFDKLRIDPERSRRGQKLKIKIRICKKCGKEI